MTGLSERNANLLWARDAAPALDDDFEPWRARVEALRPRYYRLMVDWAALQPVRGEEPNFDGIDNGCLRDLPPCREFAGMRDVLRAVKSQQEANGGWEVVVTIYGVPEWAAAGPHGCERSTETVRSRPSRRLSGYRALLRRLVGLGEEEGVELKWWSPWNEPNQPYFISPQRARCDSSAPSLAARRYVEIVRAARAEVPRGARLVLGEMAAASRPSPFVTGVAEMVRELPRDVVCAGDVWAQHQYAERGDGSTDAIAELRRALDRRPCTRGKPIWVTETGVGGAHVGDRRSRGRAELASDCRAMAAKLRQWSRDPRVDAAFQYTFREDTAFPVGLADASLSRAYPVYDLWRGVARGRISCAR